MAVIYRIAMFLYEKLAYVLSESALILIIYEFFKKVHLFQNFRCLNIIETSVNYL